MINRERGREGERGRKGGREREREGGVCVGGGRGHLFVLDSAGVLIDWV